MTEQPNLFDFATSELSQDAFLCWLLSWGKEEYKEKDKELYNAAHELIKLFQNGITDKTRICGVYKQQENIDVFVTLDNPKLAVIIEDKTFTDEHDNQINRYKETVGNWIKDGNKDVGIEQDSDMKVLAVYLKTENFLWKNQNADVVVSGENLRKIFKDVHTSNAIFNDFTAKLQERHESIENCTLDKMDSVCKWNTRNWEGFFINLFKNKDNANMGWVNNPSGGFLGCYLDWNNVPFNDTEHTVEIYKQFEVCPKEYLKLCFKISFKDVMDKTSHDDRTAFRKAQQQNERFDELKKLGWEKDGRMGKCTTFLSKTFSLKDFKETDTPEVIKKSITGFIEFKL